MSKVEQGKRKLDQTGIELTTWSASSRMQAQVREAASQHVVRGRAEACLQLAPVAQARFYVSNGAQTTQTTCIAPAAHAARVSPPDSGRASPGAQPEG